MAVSSRQVAIVLLGLISGLIFLGQDLRMGVRIRVFDIGLLAVMAVWAWHVLTQGVGRQTGPFVFAFGAYAVYLASNGLVQGSTAVAAKEAVQLALFGVYFLALAQFLDERRSVAVFLTVFLSVLWVLALHNAAHHLAQGTFAGWKDLGDQKLTHSVIVLVMAIVTVSPFRPRGRWWTLLLIAALVLLFLSGERKGWVAAPLAVFAALMVSDRGGIGWRTLRRTGGIVLAAAGLVAVAAALAPFVPYLERQVFGSMDLIAHLMSDAPDAGAGATESNRNRMAMIEIALMQMAEHPVFGIGPEAFRDEALGRAFLPIEAGNIATGPHNEILRIGAELGAVGLGLYLLAQGVVLVRALVLFSAMARLDAGERLRARLGFGLFLYGFVVNLFLAGGGLNTFFVMLPAALVFSVRLPRGGVAPAPTVIARQTA